MPCSNCDGIFARLKLHSDNSYRLILQYIGNGDSIHTAEGTAEWMSDGNRITVGNFSFRVGEGRLMLLPSKYNEVPASELTHALVKVSPDDITDVYWRLVRISGIDVKKLTLGSERFSEAFIILHSYDQRVSGSNSCNRISGKYELGEGNSLKFKQIATTMIECQGNMVQNFFNSSLKKIVRYESDGKTFTLYSNMMEELKFERVSDEKL
ncbi:MAG: META domain-containing protein [Thermaurantimonas sp.]|uniref:META domain-containing protein n=1 Tax=Thermaurantimonas sp. TaxID=2681568 RepID=UPI00391AF646